MQISRCLRRGGLSDGDSYQWLSHYKDSDLTIMHWPFSRWSSLFRRSRLVWQRITDYWKYAFRVFYFSVFSQWHSPGGWLNQPWSDSRGCVSSDAYNGCAAAKLMIKGRLWWVRRSSDGWARDMGSEYSICKSSIMGAAELCFVSWELSIPTSSIAEGDRQLLFVYK